MSYKQSILKITRNRKFLKIIKKLQLGRIIVTFYALISVFIPRPWQLIWMQEERLFLSL